MNPSKAVRAARMDVVEVRPELEYRVQEFGHPMHIVRRSQWGGSLHCDCMAGSNCSHTIAVTWYLATNQEKQIMNKVVNRRTNERY